MGDSSPIRIVCPGCKRQTVSKVTDVRNRERTNERVRRRSCLECGKRYKTVEFINPTTQWVGNLDREAL